jgi:hypothetical protein
MTKSLDFVNEKRNLGLGNSAERDGGCGLLWELGTADVEGVESVCAIGAVLQEVFLRFRQFLSAFVFTLFCRLINGARGNLSTQARRSNNLRIVFKSYGHPTESSTMRTRCV